MGCSSSSATEDEAFRPSTPRQSSANTQFVGKVPRESRKFNDTVPNKPETVPQAHQRLDEEICALESTCPGPRLLTAEAWIEHLQTLFGRGRAIDEHPNQLVLNARIVDIPSEISDPYEPESANAVANRNRDDTAKLALKLDIAMDSEKAARQEEFIARISRSAMELEEESFRADMIELARSRAYGLRQSFSRLKALYLELDYLIASANNGNYSSLNEQRLDGELESARDVRDRLGGVSEQWRTAGSLIRASAKGMLQAVECWNLVERSKSAQERIALALDCRTACHGALITLGAAQAALPQVEIPFVTLRQQSAVKHGLVYMLTDMANVTRYRHTKNVLEGFSSNVQKSVEWIHNTYKDTLQNDLSEADQTVMMFAKQLREIRKHYLSQRMGSKIYAGLPAGHSE
ncbi:uncharacterized protein LOC129779298 isoform X2 [Toxorhynchites rutilus septentrionalis]|uniref:uncharacterized protein LOC129779298 isoform X2 n=1 Tax=Toxorhynchites rutilus septentrionalis TaxID=329112 RepID=UPI0024783658|nr:uncharacterized protein LOC129779298 isoform X2 [Toxorhynchites rutilus septentrionalis]